MDALKAFQRDNSIQLAWNNGNVREWHTDNGGEFMSHDLDEFCNEFAIARSFSVPYAPPQNAQAERMWGILLKPTRAMLVGCEGIRWARQICKNVPHPWARYDGHDRAQSCPCFLHAPVITVDFN